MLNFVLSSIPKRGKNAPSIYHAFKALILIRNDSSASEESKAKKPFVNTSYVEQNMSTGSRGHINSDYSQSLTNECFNVLSLSAHNSFYICGIQKRFSALDSSEVTLSFLIKMGTLKARKRRVDVLLPL